MRSFQVREGADLGRAIAVARSDAGLTQRALAGAAGTTATYVSKIEAGRTVSLLEHQLRLLRRLGARIIVEWDAPSTASDSTAEDPVLADQHDNGARNGAP